MARPFLFLIALMISCVTGCAHDQFAATDSEVAEIFEKPSVVQVTFLTLDGNSTGTASVIGEHELLVSWHQLPEDTQFVGSLGRITIEPSDTTNFVVTEVHPGRNRAAGWARLRVGVNLPQAMPTKSDVTSSIPSGTQLYLEGFPQGVPPDAEVRSIKRERRVIPLRVFAPRAQPGETWYEQFVCVTSPELLGGGSGGSVYQIDRQGKRVRIGILGGGCPLVEGGWGWLVERPTSLAN